MYLHHCLNTKRVKYNFREYDSTWWRHWLNTFVCYNSFFCIHTPINCFLTIIRAHYPQPWSVVEAEFQCFQCEVSGYKQKCSALIASSYKLVHSILWSHTPQWTTGKWVLWSVQPMEYHAHERPFSSLSVREVWAAAELRTLMSFTTVGESHQVHTKCCRALLLWKGLLSRVSF